MPIEGQEELNLSVIDIPGGGVSSSDSHQATIPQVQAQVLLKVATRVTVALVALIRQVQFIPIRKIPTVLLNMFFYCCCRRM